MVVQVLSIKVWMNYAVSLRNLYFFLLFSPYFDIINANDLFELPVAVPIPISEEPAFAIIVRTSAKSTFTSPGICNEEIQKQSGSRSMVQSF